MAHFEKVFLPKWLRIATEAEWIGKALLQNAHLYRVHWENFHFDYLALVLIDEKVPDKSDSFVVGDLVHLKNAEQNVKWLDQNSKNFSRRFEKFLATKVPIISNWLQKHGNLPEDASQNFLASTYVYGWPIKDSDGIFIVPVRQLVNGGDWLKLMQKTIENYTDKPLIQPHVRLRHPTLL